MAFGDETGDLRSRSSSPINDITDKDRVGEVAGPDSVVAQGGSLQGGVVPELIELQRHVQRLFDC